jgi:small ligand-binding sensory domain FIST
MSRFGDGLATGADLTRAAEEATRLALEPLGGRVPDLVCAFVSGPDPTAVEAAGGRVSELAGAATVLGCSAGGVLGAGRGVEGRSAVSVFTAILPGVRLRSFHLEVMRAETGMAVVGLPETEASVDEVALLLVDPHSFPAAGFLTQANRMLPGLPVVGGLATGPAGPGSVRLFLDGRSVDRGAVGVLLQGAAARTLVSPGCRPVGPPMTVTSSSGNVVLALAGEPALQRIERLLADLLPVEQALASSGLQLGVAVDDYAEDGDYLVGPVLGTEPETGGLVVADHVPVGRTVRLQVRDADAADAGLTAALADHRRDTLDAPVGGVLLFSCLGRGTAMFGASYGGADHDPAVVQRELAPTAAAGFFADGELGPVAGANHLQAFTASMLAFPA